MAAPSDLRFLVSTQKWDSHSIETQVSCIIGIVTWRKAYVDASWTSAVMHEQKVEGRAKCARKYEDFNLNNGKTITG